MKPKLFKISMMITALIFVFTGASWAGNGKNRQQNNGPEKRIESKGHGVSSYRLPVHYKPEIDRYRHQPAYRYRYYNFYHHNKWIRNHRPHTWLGRNYNEFSLAATIREPGAEFSIGTKRSW